MKFRKTKYKPLISIQIHFLIQNVNVSFWTISSWCPHGGWETSFAGPGGNSANPEVRRSVLRLCTPSLAEQVFSLVHFWLQWKLLLYTLDNCKETTDEGEPKLNTFSINEELTSTFLLYRGLVHHRILNHSTILKIELA